LKWIPSIPASRHLYQPGPARNLQTQPLSKDDIKKSWTKTPSTATELEPKSQRDAFHAQISPDFLIRATTKDHDAVLPVAVQSPPSPTLKIRKNFRVIQKEENRDQPLRVRKPSSKNIASQSDRTQVSPQTGKWSCDVHGKPERAFSYTSWYRSVKGS
jgi:hypothetical protein